MSDKCCGTCEWFKRTEWYGFKINGECEIDGERCGSSNRICDMYREKVL